jgi:hypothetical protein
MGNLNRRVDQLEIEGHSDGRILMTWLRGDEEVTFSYINQ